MGLEGPADEVVGEVSRGDRVEITLPGNSPVMGRVAGFGRVAQAPDEQDGKAAYLAAATGRVLPGQLPPERAERILPAADGVTDRVL